MCPQSHSKWQAQVHDIHMWETRPRGRAGTSPLPDPEAPRHLCRAMREAVYSARCVAGGGKTGHGAQGRKERGVGGAPLSPALCPGHVTPLLSPPLSGYKTELSHPSCLMFKVPLLSLPAWGPQIPAQHLCTGRVSHGDMWLGALQGNPVPGLSLIASGQRMSWE